MNIRNISKMFLLWHNAPMWQKIITGLVLGVISGLVFGESTVMLKPLGDAFLHALHMVIVPVILSAVITAVTSVSDMQQMRRVTIKAFFVYLSFLFIATILAITVSNLLQPGSGISMPEVHNHLGFQTHPNTLDHVPGVPGVMDMFVEMIPSNPVVAFVNANILQIVVFGILFGIAINLAGEHGKPLALLFNSISKVSMHLTQIIMYFAPYGVFALIAWTFGMFGITALLPLLKFIGVLLLTCVLLVTVVYGSIIVFYLKKSLLDFLRKIAPAITFAISTTSSGATLPVSIKCAEEGLRVPPRIAKFMLPLGCNFNLAGLAIYLTTAVIFTSNMLGITLTTTNYITLVSTVILTTMGAGAIPGSGIVVMSAVISTMGMPLIALPLIAGIDRINDMIQTATNVISDIFAAYIVAESEHAVGIVSMPVNSSAELL
ncbi:MAG: dicarboxylate/amino acid:cation symporter [Gammaproteobacteria bacterium]|nr:dicarboxylate/amino acid:cation symporter [Gammaproteobacteria bacterium]